MSRRVSLVLVFLILLSGSALAGRRMALVIGNDTYPNLPDTEQLHNAISDARLIETTLQGLGFSVTEGTNLGRADLVDKLSEFADQLQADDVAFFFYAGHGVALNGQNYILPTDIPLPHAAARNEEQRLADHALSEADIHSRITAAKTAVVVLDSCRDNPLAASTGRSIGIGRGLARAPETQGVLSIYSAGIGQQALDRLSDADQNPNSVFTRIFAKNLTAPGKGLRDIAFSTQREVASLAQGAGQTQFPGVYSELTDDIYLNGALGETTSAPKSEAVAAPAPVEPPLSPVEKQSRAFWARIDAQNEAAKARLRTGGTLTDAQQQAMLQQGQSVSPASAPASPGVAGPIIFGVQLAEISPMARSVYQIPDSLIGAMVMKTDPAWTTNASNLAQGDVITEVNGVAVRNPAEATRELNKAKAAGKPSALLVVQRRQKAGVTFRALTLNK